MHDQASPVQCTNGTSKQMRCTLLALCVAICRCLNPTTADAFEPVIPASQLDLSHISIRDTGQLGGHDYKIHIPLLVVQADLEAVTVSVPTWSEATHALALISSKNLQSVTVRKAHVIYSDNLITDECDEQGIELMSEACRKIMRGKKVEFFKTVECTKVCPVVSLNY